VIIQDILSREHCFETRKGKILKDIRIIENRDLNNIIILDNSVEAFGLTLDNEIPILDFVGEENDQELLKLMPILQKLSIASDVRPFIQRHFNLKNIINASKEEIQEYIRNIHQ